MLMQCSFCVLAKVQRPIDIDRAPAGSAAYGRGEDVRAASGVSRKTSAKTLNALIHSACEGLSIAGEQLYAELEEVADLPDIHSGALKPKTLRLTAETPELMRYTANAEQGIKADKSYNTGEAARGIDLINERTVDPYIKEKSGDPNGQPKGIKDKRSQLRELLAPHAQALIDKVVELAKS